jgi:hypothetical protein
MLTLSAIAKNRNPHSLLVRKPNGTATLKQFGSLIKLNITLPYDPATMLLGVENMSTQNPKHG